MTTLPETAPNPIAMAFDALTKLRRDGVLAAVADSEDELGRATDAAVQAWESDHNRTLPLPAWRLLRVMIRAEIQTHRTLAEWGGGSRE